MRQIAARYQDIVSKKENQLAHTGSMDKRMRIIRSLADYYTFTDSGKAEQHLEDLRQLAEAKGDNEALAHYHIYRSFLDNQSYQYNWAITHLKKAKRLLEYEGLSGQLGDIYVELAGTYFNLNQEGESRFWLEQAERLLQSQPHPALEAQILNRKAIYYNKGFFSDKAIELLQDARKLLEGHKTPKGIRDYFILSLVYSNLGFSYIRVEDKKNSIDSYLKAIGICETFGFGMRLAWYYLHIGNAYSSMRQFKKAGKYFQKALTDTPNDLSQHARAGASANLGQLYFMQGDYDNALSMYDYAEKLYRQHQGLDDDFNHSVLERYRAQLHAEQGREGQAMQHYQTALHYATKVDDHKQMSAIYRDLAVYFEEKGDFRKAYEFQIQYSESRENHINEEKARAFSELEVKHEMEKREQEAEFLRLQTAELQLKALKAQMNPHFIFNSLNSIQGYIMRHDADQAAKFFSRFSRLIRSSLEHSEFNVIPLESEVKFLDDYLQLEKERFQGDFDYRIHIDDEVEEDIMGIPPMIVQPYVENSIKHGVRDVKNGFVDIQFKMEGEEHLLCIIADNGVGREVASKRQQEHQTTKNHRSMGTSITLQRLNIFNQSSGMELSTCTIDLKDPQGQPTGTRVEVRIPIMEIDPQFFGSATW